MEYLSLSRYITGAGGLLLLGTVLGLVVLISHLYYNDPDHPGYDALSTGLISFMLGLILCFVLLPTSCFIKATLMCYSIM